MRALFTFTGGNGHFRPTLPVARALAERGHEVLYACQDAMVPVVEAAGFPARASGGPTLTDPGARLPLVPVDRTREAAVIATGFAGRTARRRIGPLLDLAGDWRPDVVVRDELDFAAAVVAERLGLPHAAVVVLAAGGLVTPSLVDAPLSELRAEQGLTADPDCSMLHRYLTLEPVPPGFRDPSDPLPGTAHAIRPSAAGASSSPAWRTWLDSRPDRPCVYFTLGTVFGQESGDLFTRVLDGLQTLPVNVLVTVGNEIDPGELGARPANVRVERFIDQDAVLPLCAATVSHGGSGSVVGALSYGIPLVLLPMGADQPANADRCAALGVGVVLDPLTVGPAEVGSSVSRVLTTDSYRVAADRLASAARSLPPVEHAATLVEQLAGDRMPIVHRRI